MSCTALSTPCSGPAMLYRASGHDRDKAESIIGLLNLAGASKSSEMGIEFRSIAIGLSVTGRTMIG